MQIEALLLEYAPTMMLVEHDQTFADRVATKEDLAVTAPVKENV